MKQLKQNHKRMKAGKHLAAKDSWGAFASAGGRKKAAPYSKESTLTLSCPFSTSLPFDSQKYTFPSLVLGWKPAFPYKKGGESHAGNLGKGIILYTFHVF